MWLDSYGMTPGIGSGRDAEYKDCASEFIEAVNLPTSSGDVLENRLGLSAVRVSHAAQIWDSKHSDDIAFSNSAAVDILDARWLRRRHGI
jgi:hypothetical protein